jgi:hypothetical protein
MAKLTRIGEDDTGKPVFASILDRPMKLIERPKPLPVGQYDWKTLSYQEGISSRKQTPYVEFTCKCLGPHSEESVDQDALAKWLTNPDGTKSRITDVVRKMQFYLVDKVMWRLQRFLGHLGFDENTDASIAQVLAETPGCDFIGTVKHDTSEDGEITFDKIIDTAPMKR